MTSIPLISANGSHLKSSLPQHCPHPATNMRRSLTTTGHRSGFIRDLSKLTHITNLYFPADNMTTFTEPDDSCGIDVHKMTSARTVHPVRRKDNRHIRCFFNIRIIRINGTFHRIEGDIPGYRVIFEARYAVANREPSSSVCRPPHGNRRGL